MNKQIELNTLARKIENSDLYKKGFTGKMVLGEGNIDAEIMFVGEAPGKQEAENGRPFIGRSGRLLRTYINSIGLKEENVYITSPIKYLPLRGTPALNEIKESRPDFYKQIEIINPKILVLLGKTAIYAALDESIPILKHHGEIREKFNRYYFLSLHPAAVVRFSKYKPLFNADFQKLKTIIQAGTFRSDD